MNHSHAARQIPARRFRFLLPLTLLFALLLPALAQDATAPSYDTRLEKAVGLYSEKQYAEAAALFELLTKSDATRKEAFLWLGHARARLNQWTKAREAYKVYAELAPTDVEGFRELARAYEEEGNRDLAKLWCKKALELEPTSADLKKQLARLDAAGAPPTAADSGDAAAAKTAGDKPAADSTSFWRTGLAGVTKARTVWWGRLIIVVLQIIGILQMPFYWKAFAERSPLPVDPGTAFFGGVFGSGLWYILLWGIPAGWTWALAALCVLASGIGSAGGVSRS